MLLSFLALDTEYLLTMGLDSAASRVVEVRSGHDRTHVFGVCCLLTTHDTRG
jgi:hypothetical protein